MTKIQEVPDEILLKIFSYLPQFDKFYNVPLVSKRFLKISRDPQLAKSLSLKYINKFIFEDVKKMLDRSQWLQELSLDYCLELTSQILCYALRTNQKLTSIKIGTNECLSDVPPCQEELKINPCDFKDHGKNIKDLAICNIEIEESKIMDILCLNLKSLRLDTVVYEPKYLDVLTKSSEFLEAIDVPTLCGVEVDSLKSFFKAKMHTLKKLTICDIYHDTSEMVEKLRTIECLYNLEELVLDGYMPSDSYNSLVKIPNLKVLHITDKSSYETGYKISLLYHRLNINQLEELKLSFAKTFRNDSEYDAINFFCHKPSFHNNIFPNIQRLELDDGYNLITEDQIFTLVRNCPNLKYLVLDFYEFKFINDEILAKLIHHFGIDIEIKNFSWMKKRINKYLRSFSSRGSTEDEFDIYMHNFPNLNNSHQKSFSE